MERKTYVIGLLCSALSQLVFFLFAYYHTDETGRSWILFHQEDWRWAFVLSIMGIFFIVLGIIADIKGVDEEKERPPPQEKREEKREPPQEPQKPGEKATPLDDLEAPSGAPGDAKSPAETVGAPRIWEEEVFE